MSSDPYHLPTQALHHSLADKPVLIVSDDRIHTANLKELEKMESYYINTLEALAGKQIWNILDTLQKVQDTQRLRKTFLKNS